MLGPTGGNLVGKFLQTDWLAWRDFDMCAAPICCAANIHVKGRILLTRCYDLTYGQWVVSTWHLFHESTAGEMFRGFQRGLVIGQKNHMLSQSKCHSLFEPQRSKLCCLFSCHPQ